MRERDSEMFHEKVTDIDDVIDREIDALEGVEVTCK